MTRPARHWLPLVLTGAFVTGIALMTAGPASAAPATRPGAALASTTSTTVTCNDPITGITLLATLIGTPQDDIVWARPADVVATLGGNDVVFSDFANPRVSACLGDGADWFGGSDPQSFPQGTGFGVRGEGGPDVIRGSTGNDRLLGGNGNDILIGGPGSDTVDGGPGVDQCDAEVEINCEV